MTKPKCYACKLTEDIIQRVLPKLDRYLNNEDPNIYDLMDSVTMLNGLHEALKAQSNKEGI